MRIHKWKSLEIGKLYHVNEKGEDRKEDYILVYKNKLVEGELKCLYYDNILFFVSMERTEYGFGLCYIFIDKDGDKLCLSSWQAHCLKKMATL